MASKSPNAYVNLILLLLLVSIAISAPLAMAHLVSEPPIAFGAEKFSFFRCISFISDATKCLREVLKQAIAPHPSCCEAMAKLNDCSSSILNGIPADEMTLIKDVCALWGVTIP